MKKICFIVDSIFSIGGVQRVTAVIAKALAKDYDVTIVTFDEPSTEDTSLYGLADACIHYRFFHFPKSNHLKWKCSKIYSALYRKILPQTALTSEWYSYSSFLSEKREALITELREGNYDVIIGVHASLAVRLAVCKPQLGHAKLIGWIHNSYQALFGEGSRYCIGPELRKYYEYELEKERKNARSGYDRFCSWWFWITALLLAALFALWVCDKIPACKPWTTVIKVALRL